MRLCADTYCSDIRRYIDTKRDLNRAAHITPEPFGRVRSRFPFRFLLFSNNTDTDGGTVLEIILI